MSYAVCSLDMYSYDYSGDDKDKIPAVTSGALDTFLVCPNCEKEFEVDGDKTPMSLRCGHTFCLGKIL